MLFHIVTITTLEDLAHFRRFLESQNGLVRKSDFREDPLSIMYKWLFFKINYFLTFLFGILHKYQNLLPLGRLRNSSLWLRRLERGRTKVADAP